MGLQKKQQKMAEVEFPLISPTAVPPGNLWLQGSTQQTREMKLAPCLLHPRPWIRRDSLPTKCSWLTGSPCCRVPDRQEGSRSSATSDRSCSSSPTGNLRLSSGFGVEENEEADWLSKMRSKLEALAHPISYSEAKSILRNSFRTMGDNV